MNKAILCKPTVFNIPTCKMDQRLVALIMPFDESLKDVCRTIKSVARSLSLKCQRADDLFDNSILIQDIFTLIFKAPILVCDCTGRNPNVMYEIGIAHLLGREVILIAQSLDDIPFDLRHHRIIMYKPDRHGLKELRKALVGKIENLIKPVDDYVSVPTLGADEIIVERFWNKPQSKGGGIAPIRAGATEVIRM